MSAIAFARPPQSVQLTIKELVERVAVGGVRVPRFQRPLRWKSPDVVALFDSILRGYPIGSLLFWQRPAPADPALRIGAASISVPACPEAWWVVDGQQRTTALAATLLRGLDHGRELTWAAHFNVRTQSFHPRPAPSTDRACVDLPVLFDLIELMAWMQDSSLSKDDLLLVRRVHERITASPLNAYLIQTDDEQVLRAVFARMNSTGVRMRSDEVFHALRGPTEGEAAPDAIDLDALSLRCDTDGFGAVPRGDVLKALMGIAGLDPTERVDRLDPQTLQRLPPASEAELALTRVVEFLQAPCFPSHGEDPGAGIPAYAFLPYPAVFTLLARFLARHAQPSVAQRHRLRQWVWRGILTGAHNKTRISSIRSQLRLIQGADPETDLSALEQSLSAPPRVDWSLRKYVGASAHTRVELLVLLGRGPRDTLDGRVSWRAVVAASGRVTTELLRAADLDALPDADRRLARTIANRVILDADGGAAWPVLRAWRAPSEADVLHSHFLDADLLAARADGAPPPAGILQRRAEAIQLAVTQFVSANAGLGEPTIRDTSAYFADEPFDVEAE